MYGKPSFAHACPLCVTGAAQEHAPYIASCTNMRACSSTVSQHVIKAHAIVTTETRASDLQEDSSYLDNLRSTIQRETEALKDAA